MNSSVRNRYWIAAVGLVISLLVVQVMVSAAQEPVKIPPRSNYQYRKDHAEVTELMKISNAGERAAKLEKLVLILGMGCYVFSDELLGDDCRLEKTPPNISAKQDSN